MLTPLLILHLQAPLTQRGLMQGSLCFPLPYSTDGTDSWTRHGEAGAKVVLEVQIVFRNMASWRR